MFLPHKGNNLKAYFNISLTIYHLVKKTEFQPLTTTNKNLHSI